MCVFFWGVCVCVDVGVFWYGGVSLKMTIGGDVSVNVCVYEYRYQYACVMCVDVCVYVPDGKNLDHTPWPPLQAP